MIFRQHDAEYVLCLMASKIVPLLKEDAHDAWNLRSCSKPLCAAMALAVTGLSFPVEVDNSAAMRTMTDTAAKHFKHAQRVSLHIGPSSGAPGIFRKSCFPATTAVDLVVRMVEHADLLQVLSDWAPFVRTLKLISCHLLPFETATCTALTSLQLQSVHGITNLSLLSECPVLRYLQVTECMGLERIGASFPALHDLRIDVCGSLMCLDGLQTCPSLQRLQLSFCINLESLMGLNGSSLEELTLECCFGIGNLMDSLEHCSSLKRLEIDNCSATGLHSIRSLTHLQLSNVQCDQLDLRHSSALTFLSLDCLDLCDLRILTGCTELKKLDIKHCYTLNSLVGLEACVSLTELNITSCDELRSLVGIEPCTCLAQLNLCYCTSLWNIVDFTVRQLSVTRCPCWYTPKF